MNEQKVFVGMVLMLIFGEVLGLYGCVIGLLVCGQLLTIVPVPPVSLSP